MILKSGRITRDFWHNEKLFKLHSMKTIQELNKSKIPIIAIDSSLAKYRDKTPFTAKLAKANEMLKTAKLPNKKNRG